MEISVWRDDAMMRIKDIKWISETAKEAELIVTDGVNECLVFSQPCNLRTGEILFEPLKALDVEKLMKVIGKDPMLLMLANVKQGRFGDNTTPKPGFFARREKMKW